MIDSVAVIGQRPAQSSCSGFSSGQRGSSPAAFAETRRSAEANVTRCIPRDTGPKAEMAHPSKARAIAMSMVMARPRACIVSPQR
jgi:hypothetical protein